MREIVLLNIRALSGGTLAVLHDNSEIGGSLERIRFEGSVEINFEKILEFCTCDDGTTWEPPKKANNSCKSYVSPESDFLENTQNKFQKLILFFWLIEKLFQYYHW